MGPGRKQDYFFFKNTRIIGNAVRMMRAIKIYPMLLVMFGNMPTKK
jgi:hypothetical protein